MPFYQYLSPLSLHVMLSGDLPDFETQFHIFDDHLPVPQSLTWPLRHHSCLSWRQFSLSNAKVIIPSSIILIFLSEAILSADPFSLSDTLLAFYILYSSFETLLPVYNAIISVLKSILSAFRPLSLPMRPFSLPLSSSSLSLMCFYLHPQPFYLYLRSIGILFRTFYLTTSSSLHWHSSLSLMCFFLFLRQNQIAFDALLIIWDTATSLWCPSSCPLFSVT